jgi:hypothetical protein
MYSRFVSLKPLLFLYIIFFDKSIFEKTFTIKENSSNIQGVSAKTFEPNSSVICQRIFMKFKMQTVKVQLVIIKLPQVKKCNFSTCFLYRKLCAIIIRLLNIKK